MPPGSDNSPGTGIGMTTNPPRASCSGEMSTSWPSRPNVAIGAETESASRDSGMGQGAPMIVFQTIWPASGWIPHRATPPDSRSWNVATIRLAADWIGARAGPGTGSGAVGWIDPCSRSRTNRPG